MAVNIPNFKKISITKMVQLVIKQLKLLCEIKGISALCNKDKIEYIYYGIKVLLRKNTIDTELPLFLGHEDGRINISYKGYESRGEIEPPKTKSINNKIVESDYSHDSSSIAGSSSPIEIKKEYISPRSDIFESSEGNKTPSEHDIMAEKARLGKISEKEFMDYVFKVDCASQGSNLAGIDLGSDPPDQSSSDIEFFFF
ncbi:hypothetical protein AYI70_g7781 [Smittium culicis]|uniref:Uncharacterized protein n=1 Tax=Smittium culicis TaxID=133412 RepID=A0A1R1XJ48_9FUNG|nr:hypothetical protein AYI70_g7781 [Smittium culicis]